MIQTKLDYSEVRNVMVSKMCNYFIINDIHSGILGISGGIDSTLVACLLKEVSKKLRESGFDFTFYGRSLPTPTTSKEEYKASVLVGDVFCDNFKAADPDFINDAAWNFLEAIERGENIETTYSREMPEIRFRCGNIKSRLRTVFLYDLAKDKGGIVIGTDNYTEYLLGFSTIGGDGLYDYCPIQYLWKTEIYQMCEFLMKDAVEKGDYAAAHAIQESYKLAPQDGLGISNTDMDQIGCKNYYEVDEILYALLYDVNSLPEIENRIGKEPTKKVISRHNASEFKRHHPVFISRDLYERPSENS